MEDFSFDIGEILSEDEAEKLFEEQVPAKEEIPADEPEEEQKDNNHTEEEEEEEPTSPESVGAEEDKTGANAIVTESDGSSPSIYSSIASALKNDGIFPDLEDSDIEAVKTPEDFAELFEKVKNLWLDDTSRRINEALGNGVEPDTVGQYERTLQYLNSINEEVVAAEGEEGDNLRKQLIYNDLVTRGYSHDKAMKEVEKSFNSNSDVEDAKDALEALTKFYTAGYENIRNEAKEKAEAFKKEQLKQAADFKKMVLEDEIVLGDTKLDKKTCQKVYESVSKPVYKDPDTGRLLTAVQKFQKEKPLEFLKQLGMWYVLTDGGKNTNGFIKDKLREEKNKSIKELGRKINTTSLKNDGSLSFVSTTPKEGSDPLLSDGWKIGW